jgi:hypothetical protein
MMQGVEPGLERLVTRALAYYRAPALHAEAVARDAIVPDDLLGLFRIAGGADLEECGLTLTRPQDRDEARDAARFYIEQVLFRADADHYRLLGLTRAASEADIKEHHRLLMRLTHPDRSDAGDAWRDGHAGRINRAYNTLRDAAARAAYDASLAAARPMGGEAATTRVARPAWHMEQGAYPAANRRGSNRAPIFIMSGVVLLAGAFVLSVYFANRPVAQPTFAALEGSAETVAPAAATQAIAAQDTPPNEAPPLGLSAELQARLEELLVPDKSQTQPASARGAAHDDPARRAQPATRANTVARGHIEAPPAGVRERGVEGPGANTTKPQLAETLAEPAPAATLPYAKTGGMPLQLSAQVAEASRPVSAPPPAPTPVAQAAPQPIAQAAPSPPAPVKVADEPDNRLTAYDLGRLFSRMSAYYERGDLNGFMALFDEGARAEVGGKRQIRQDYDNLFRATDSRRLELGHVNWAGSGDAFIGKVPYRAMVKGKSDDNGRISTGMLYMEVVKRAGEARITALFYTVGERS